MTNITPKEARAESKRLKNRSDAIRIAASDEDKFAAIARTLTRPEIGSAFVLEKWSPNLYDVNDLAEELATQVKAVNGGDMRRAEGLLIAQAHTLDAIFTVLMRRATTVSMLSQWEAYMRMGMKAQAQCRATLEALAEMKNPRAVAFVKQANIANGPQQVNNGSAGGQLSGQYAQARTHGEQSAPAQNKLLEGDHGQPGGRMDTRAAQAAERSYQTVEAVGKIYRAAKP